MSIHCSPLKRILGLFLLFGWLAATSALDAACCYFSAKDNDVLQPGQKVFLTWDPDGRTETFTVQPKFEGNATDFGMVIPTPARPKLDEMPRDFFKALAVFTILEPMDMKKFKPKPQMRFGAGVPDSLSRARTTSAVRVLEAGVVGNLDYKIITADDAADLFAWLKENNYTYRGDEKTLQFYIDKKWIFTVMKIDPTQIRRGGLDSPYQGEVTPTRFTFKTDQPVYPLRITRISVKDQTEALFYVQAPWKLDFTAAAVSFQHTWQPMWHQAMDMAVEEFITPEEKAWREASKPRVDDALKLCFSLKEKGFIPATLEWAKKIGPKDAGWISGEEKFNREAPAEEVVKMKCLEGHVRPDQFVTKIRKIFKPSEMDDDLVLTRAGFNQQMDNIQHFSMLPTSPP
ncbi:MAG: DUF2330 domain-containing protein [Verrucomicrobiales bacterium]